MSEPTIPDEDRQRRLEEAMAEYLIAADAGRLPEPESFLARNPDLRAELVAFLADLSAVASLVEPFLAAAAPPEPGTSPEPMTTRPPSAVTTEVWPSMTDPGATGEPREGAGSAGAPVGIDSTSAIETMVVRRPPPGSTMDPATPRPWSHSRAILSCDTSATTS